MSLLGFLHNATYHGPLVTLVQIAAVAFGYVALHLAVAPGTRLRDRPLLSTSFAMSVAVILVANAVRANLAVAEVVMAR